MYIHGIRTFWMLKQCSDYQRISQITISIHGSRTLMFQCLLISFAHAAMSLILSPYNNEVYTMKCCQVHRSASCVDDHTVVHYTSCLRNFPNLPLRFLFSTKCTCYLQNLYQTESFWNFYAKYSLCLRALTMSTTRWRLLTLRCRCRRTKGGWRHLVVANEALRHVGMM